MVRICATYKMTSQTPERVFIRLPENTTKTHAS